MKAGIDHFETFEATLTRIEKDTELAHERIDRRLVPSSIQRFRLN